MGCYKTVFSIGIYLADVNLQHEYKERGLLVCYIDSSIFPHSLFRIMDVKYMSVYIDSVTMTLLFFPSLPFLI